MAPNYESPQVKVLGSITDLTQVKPGIYFDFPGSAQGDDRKPSPGKPGTS